MNENIIKGAEFFKILLLFCYCWNIIYIIGKNSGFLSKKAEHSNVFKCLC